MNVTVTPVDQALVRAQLRELRTRKHKDAEREYAALASSLKEIVDAKGLIDVAVAIRGGGLDSNGRPKFALARADKTRVNLATFRDRVHFNANDPRYRNTPHWLRSFPQFIESFDFPGVIQKPDAYAAVPLVPVRIRNRTTGPLSRYHILWEVDRWVEHTRPVTDRDPILLRRIGKTGTLFAFIDKWDVTPLEQLVLDSMRTSAT